MPFQTWLTRSPTTTPSPSTRTATPRCPQTETRRAPESKTDQDVSDSARLISLVAAAAGLAESYWMDGWMQHSQINMGSVLKESDPGYFLPLFCLDIVRFHRPF